MLNREKARTVLRTNPELVNVEGLLDALESCEVGEVGEYEIQQAATVLAERFAAKYMTFTANEILEEVGLEPRLWLRT